MIYKYSYGGGRNLNQFPGGSFGCMIAAILVVVGGYYLLQGLYYLLLWAAPALLVLALIINWRVFPDTIKNWLKSLENNPLSALFTLALVVLVFPFFSLYLFLKAIGYRKMEQLRNQFGQDGASNAPQEDAFAEYEELESTQKRTVEDDDTTLPELPIEPAPKKEQNPYDSLFN